MGVLFEPMEDQSEKLTFLESRSYHFGMFKGVDNILKFLALDLLVV